MFTWGPLHDMALQEVKDVITNPAGPVLKHFEPGLPIQLLTDASRKGLGYCLVQMDSHRKDAKPKLITVGSPFLGTAEINYVVIELELLAIQWAITKCRLYLAGTKFKIITDNKPHERQAHRSNEQRTNPTTDVETTGYLILEHTF